LIGFDVGVPWTRCKPSNLAAMYDSGGGGGDDENDDDNDNNNNNNRHLMWKLCRCGSAGKCMCTFVPIHHIITILCFVHVMDLSL
jgi:hypothetical protein